MFNIHIDSMSCCTRIRIKNDLSKTDELKEDFERLTELVNITPKLDYVDDTTECQLCTYASEYRIGAYLYQWIGGKEVPIKFMSKRLTDTQRRWSVPEKEAFAIFYSLKKLAYLLRERHFKKYKSMTFI